MDGFELALKSHRFDDAEGLQVGTVNNVRDCMGLVTITEIRLPNRNQQ